MFYVARCMNIIFNSLLTQLGKYDVHTTRKIKSIHTIFLITYYYYLRTNMSAYYQRAALTTANINNKPRYLS